MKYWRGYLTAGVLGFFSWALLQFAKSHTQLVDMFYPYVTRMIQGALAQWSGGTDDLLWQLVLVLFAVIALVTIVLMIVLRWNPIQWFGWITAVACLVLLLNTAAYGLNDYAGPLADDLKLNTTEYTLSELESAAHYYLQQANDLAGRIPRKGQDADFPTLEEMKELSDDGFQQLTYTDHIPIFYGAAQVEDWTNWTQWNALPVKDLGWEDYFTSIGVDGIHVPVTGEIAINTQIPTLGQPFVMARLIANRLCIANTGDAEFAAYLACSANPSMAFQYSAQLMAYRSCRDALADLPGAEAKNALIRLESGESTQLSYDLSQYDLFFEMNRDESRVERLQTLQNFWDDLCTNVRDLLGVEKLAVETDSFYDLLVSWHIQEVVLPTILPEEEVIKFDPYDKDYINGLVAPEDTTVEETTGETTEPAEAE